MAKGVGGGGVNYLRKAINKGTATIWEKLIIYGTMYPHFQRLSKKSFPTKTLQRNFYHINSFSFLYQEGNSVLLFINIFSNLPVTFSVVIYEIPVKPFQSHSHCLRLQMWRLDHDFTFTEGALMSHCLR